MSYYAFDKFGWYVGETDSRNPRSTEVQPPPCAAGERANWTVRGWVARSFTEENAKTADDTRQRELANARAVEIDTAVQAHLDSKAAERNYASILSACTYAASAVAKFKAEGQACVTWRDACWAKCYEIQQQVATGARTLPTVPEVIAELPILVWPV